jgi:hypothetical protein
VTLLLLGDSDRDRDDAVFLAVVVVVGFSVLELGFRVVEEEVVVVGFTAGLVPGLVVDGGFTAGLVDLVCVFAGIFATGLFVFPLRSTVFLAAIDDAVVMAGVDLVAGSDLETAVERSVGLGVVDVASAAAGVVGFGLFETSCDFTLGFNCGVGLGCFLTGGGDGCFFGADAEIRDVVFGTGGLDGGGFGLKWTDDGEDEVLNKSKLESEKCDGGSLPRSHDVGRSRSDDRLFCGTGLDSVESCNESN